MSSVPNLETCPTLPLWSLLQFSIQVHPCNKWAVAEYWLIACYDFQVTGPLFLQQIHRIGYISDW